MNASTALRSPAAALPPPAEGTRFAIGPGLSIYDVADLKPRLLEAVANHAVLNVDLSQVESIDSAGIQLLMLAKVHALAYDHRFHLVGHSPVVLEIFELFRVAGYFRDPAEHLPLAEGALS